MINERRKNKTAIVIGLFLILSIGFFIFYILAPSAKNEALNNLAACNTKEDVKNVWDIYSNDLAKDEDFLLQIRKKLTAFDLPDSSIIACQKWLPSPPSSFNLIIVPDLSDRIMDEENNPNQIDRDKDIIRSIWKSFIDCAKRRPHTNDRLIVTITDPKQANGEFGTIADKLITDLSRIEEKNKEEEKVKTNRDYFTDYRTTQFHSQLGQLYALAKKNSSEPNYYNFLEIDLNNLLKKSTFFEQYQNKLIILTDGYIENGEEGMLTEIHLYEDEFKQAVKSDSIEAVFSKYHLNLTPANIDLSTTEILICEINERKNGNGYHKPVLMKYWTDWFTQMNVKQPMICLPRSYSLKQTCQEIDKFIQKE